MLTQLTIKNYAIIHQAQIKFDHRLNIITGETGAGKSILMGALGIILGERADTKILMYSDEKCVVEGVFKIDGYAVQSFFDANELDYDSQCIIRREISTAGKSRAFINDTPVSLQLLKELGSQLVEIVSQHQTLELNEKSFQLALVDTIGDNAIQLKNYQQTIKLFKQKEKQLRECIEQEVQARKDEDYLTFVLNELKEVNPLPNEQIALEQQLDVLSNADTIQQASDQANRALSADENSLVDQLRNIKTLLSPAAKHHTAITALLNRIDSTIIELKDIAVELEQIAEATQSDPAELNRTEERLQILFNLQKKHRVNNNEELLELLNKLTSDLNRLGSLQDQINELQTELVKLELELAKQAEVLNTRRNKAIPQIEKRVNELLKQVEMPNANLKAEITSLDSFNEYGKDEIQLIFSANKGAPLLPLHKVASGGELSRLMLCIKSLMSDRVALPTIVFDEIDTGISGEAAMKVSKVMKDHAGKHQVIAITHLPQIAGKADAHYYVYKTSDKTTTHTFIKKLNDQERLEEIARMLHGANPSEKVIEAAKELIG